MEIIVIEGKDYKCFKRVAEEIYTNLDLCSLKNI